MRHRRLDTPMLRAGFLFFLAALLVSTAGADDLTTRDGTVYKDYKVTGHDAGFITIMYADGGGKIPLSELPDDLQKKYGYDPTVAAAAAQSAAEQDRKNRQAIAEQERRQQQAAAQPKPLAPALTASSAPVLATTSSAVAAAPVAPVAPPPTGAMTWKEIEQTGLDIAELETDVDNLGENNGNNFNEEKVSDETKIINLRHKLEVEQSLLSHHLVPGPHLNESELAAVRQQIVDADADLQAMSRESSEQGHGEDRDRVHRDEETLYRLNMMINYAND